ncbi:MAG: hypothetical protein ABIS29_01950 [Vicinamibacterales bacterium]
MAVRGGAGVEPGWSRGGAEVEPGWSRGGAGVEPGPSRTESKRLSVSYQADGDVSRGTQQAQVHKDLGP